MLSVPGLELGEELGHGAYSIVYRGVRKGTPCAVKVPRTRGRWTKWVHREAVALARVRDPGLPAVLEVGEADGLPYLVMELVEGETLADRIARGAMPEKDALRIVEHLAGTLASVHDAGLLHRDVKPRNIVLESDGRVRLIDFGFATPIERAASGEDAAGTPAYAAPEQLHAPARIDGRADLYALGRVLLECVTGQLLARDIQPTQLQADGAISEATRILLDGLLVQGPEHRYPDARALAADVREAREGRRPKGACSFPRTRPRAALVGRAGELEKFTKAWEHARTRGTVLVLRAPSGAGKTRLLAAFAARASDTKGRVVEVFCRPRDTPLTALRQLFDAHLAIASREPGGRAAAEANARDLVGENLVPFARLLMPRLFGRAEQDVEAPPEGFVEAAAEIFVRFVRRAPGATLVTVDDFQWIDPVSRSVLERIAHRIEETPVVLAFGLRAEHSMDRLARLPRMPTVIELQPLDTSRVGALVANHLGTRDLPHGLVARVAALAGGTPLGVLEVLEALLDLGAVRPEGGAWIFDVARADRTTLPEGARALLARRFEELPEATRRTLRVAALIGTRFDDELLARGIGLSVEDVGYALAEARRAGLIEAVDAHTDRFLHDSVRDLAVEGLDEDSLRKIHQRIAEAMDRSDSPSTDDVFALAEHYAAGELGKSPLRAYRAATTAATVALQQFDNETALRFLQLARSAASISKIALDARFERNEGEAHLRIGALDQSLEAFERALAGAQDGRERAILLGRIAWVHQTRSDPDKAWQTLERAFQAVRKRMPKETALSAAATLREWAAASVPLGKAATLPDRADIELLCELHYQNARLGMEYGRPAHIVQSTLAARALSRRLEASPTKARVLAMHGLVLSLLGRKEMGERELSEAERMAADLQDVVTQAFCVQLRSVSACWAGQLDRALVLLHDCVERYGPWLELHEYLIDTANAQFIETMRGRDERARDWSTRATDRLQRRGGPTTGAAVHILYRARADLAMRSDKPALVTSAPERPPDGYYRLLCWGPEARFLLESGASADALERLIAEFDREGHKARSSYPMLFEYYASVAHARVNQCLAVAKSERASRLPALEKALADVQAAAKLALFKAHAKAIEAYACWFRGDAKRARAVLAEAEELGSSESAPWVLYSVARLRAHMLKDEGKADAAVDQARIAETLAREHGAEARARLVRDEFGLSPPSNVQAQAPTTSLVRTSSRRTKRQLSTLLHVVRAPTADVDTRGRATAILDDLLNDLDAAHGLLSFEHEGRPEVLVTRTREGEAFAVDKTSWRSSLLKIVRAGGQPWGGSPTESQWGLAGEAPDAARVAAIPLFLFERPCGVVCLERRPTDPPFSREERDVFMALSYQIPIALEVARLIAERERLHAGLQQIQKMEAVGQLAGGVAHDFNNVLAIIHAGVEFLQGHECSKDPAVAEELGIIMDRVKAANELAKQLLSFSRNQPMTLVRYEADHLLKTLEPMLRRAAKRYDWKFDYGAGAAAIVIDKHSLEQALVNLVVNASHAMEKGGRLTVRTRRIMLDESAVARGAPRAGEYVAIEVEDAGTGMSAETLKRIFDPFSTTKAPGVGTGLGLTMVYSFVKRCGGHIEVTSELGKGTCFALQFPIEQVAEARVDVEAKPKPKKKKNGSNTILVVDDDRRLREAVARMLETSGYKVILAESSAHALDLVNLRGPEIALAILDVLMPDMPGPELGKRFADMQLPAKLLFMSAYAPEKLTDRPPNDEFLMKPFSAKDLLGHVRRLLDVQRSDSSMPPRSS